ncbi:MAG: hypothetical protein JEZ08_10385 [Clostridiales bacterium]|nr:hypothetical protein [Clostridiales bacterium]
MYWVQEWARVRQKELVRYKKEFLVHNSYTTVLSKDELMAAFEEIWHLFYEVYEEITLSPEVFGMPLHKFEDFNSFTRQVRESRSGPYRPFNLLYNLLLSGEFQNSDFIVDIKKLRERKTIKNNKNIFEAFGNYGFTFEGLKNGKVSEQDITIEYPDNKNVIIVLKNMAEKANATDRTNDFLSCHYKLFQDDMNTANYGDGADIVADKMHTDDEKNIIYRMDSLLKKKGYFSKEKSWNEGLGYAYYDKESTMLRNGPYHYWLLSWKTELILYLRIRNASRCIDYLKGCPESVRDIFRKSDEGCESRKLGICNFGQEYNFEGKTHWKCGCCNAPFYFKPLEKDIPHYIKLLELGLKK